MVHLIVPLDESVLAEAALPWAAAVARARELGVHLLTVVPSAAAYWEFGDIDPRESPVRERSTVPDYLENVRHSAQLAGVRVTVEVREGDVAGEILAASDEPDAAMVVITTRGRGDGRPGERGSVANKLMRATKRPLLVVPPEATLEGFESMLVTLDGSHDAEAVLSDARALAALLGSQVHLLHVVEDDLGWGMVDEDWAGYRERLSQDAKAYLARVALEGEVVSVTGGHAVASVLDYAGEYDCRVIAMATHGRSGPVRLELGSTADAVLRQTNRPVLLVRVPGR